MPILKIKNNGVWETIGGNNPISGGSVSVQANWAQNNPNAVDYIKNRPFYEDGEIVEIPILTNIDIPFENVGGNMWIYEIPSSFITPEEGVEYKIIIGTNTYNYVCKSETLEGNTFYSLGVSVIELEASSTYGAYPSEPISIIVFPDNTVRIFIFDSETAPGAFSLYKIINAKEETLIDDTFTLNITEDGYFAAMLPGVHLIPETSYTITFDNNEYTLICSSDNIMTEDPILVYGLETDNAMFMLGDSLSGVMYFDPTAATNNTSIEKHFTLTGYVSGIKTIDPKYITGSSGGGGVTKAQVTTMINNAIGSAIGGSY